MFAKKKKKVFLSHMITKEDFIFQRTFKQSSPFKRRNCISVTKLEFFLTSDEAPRHC